MRSVCDLVGARIEAKMNGNWPYNECFSFVICFTALSSSTQ